jgi:hypothetical protein
MFWPVLQLTNTTQTDILIWLFSLSFVLLQLKDSLLQNVSYILVTITSFNFTYTSGSYHFLLFHDVLSARYFWKSNIFNYNYFMYNLNGHKNSGSMDRGSNRDRHKSSKTSTPALGSTQTPIQCETAANPRRSISRLVRVPAHLHLVQRLRMTGALPLLTYMQSFNLYG